MGAIDTDRARRAFERILLRHYIAGELPVPPPERVWVLIVTASPSGPSGHDDYKLCRAAIGDLAQLGAVTAEQFKEQAAEVDGQAVFAVYFDGDDSYSAVTSVGAQFLNPNRARG